MNRRLLYIVAAVAAVLVLRWYLRRPGAQAVAQGPDATPPLLNWRLPWEIQQMEEDTVGNLLMQANRNLRGFTPGAP